MMTERKSGTIEVYENKAGDGVIPTTLDGRNIREISVNGWDIDDDVFQRLREDIEDLVDDAQFEQDRLAREKYIQESPNRNAILATEDLHTALYWMSLVIQKEEDEHSEHQVYDFNTAFHMIRRALGHLSEITGEGSKYSYTNVDYYRDKDPYQAASDEMTGLDDRLYEEDEELSVIDDTISYDYSYHRDSGKYTFKMVTKKSSSATRIHHAMRQLYIKLSKAENNTTGGE